MASISGLGTLIVGEERREGGRGRLPFTITEGNDPKKASACHSYHTWRSFVSLQIETCNSELLGRYSGSWRDPSSLRNDMVAEMTHLEWKKKRKPAEHVFRYLFFTMRMYAQADIPVQHSLKITC